MSMAIAHFAVGVTCATIALTYLPVRTKYVLPLITASGIWAIVPDSWWVLPFYERSIRSIGHSPLGNVFWFHSLMDRVDARNSRPFAAVLIGIYFLVTVIYAEHRGKGSVMELDRDGSEKNE